MRGTGGESITISDWTDKLTGPARRNGCLSAREVRQRAAVARTMALTLPEDQHQAVLDQIPTGYVEGLVALERRYESEKAQLAGNHPKRLKMLNGVEDLPYLSHWQLLRRAAKASLTPATASNMDISWHRDTPPAERAAIRAEAAAMVRLLILLILWSSSGQHKYPDMALLALLWALGALSIMPSQVVPPPASARPTRVVRPPGRLALAEPHVARAPGRGVSLVVHRNEGHVGLCAFEGTL